MADTIVVTGLGAVSALGLTADEAWQAARGGVGGIEPHVFEAGANGPPAFTVPAAMVKGDALGALEAALGRRIQGA